MKKLDLRTEMRIHQYCEYRKNYPEIREKTIIKEYDEAACMFSSSGWWLCDWSSVQKEKENGK